MSLLESFFAEIFHLRVRRRFVLFSLTFFLFSRYGCLLSYRRHSRSLQTPLFPLLRRDRSYHPLVLFAHLVLSRFLLL